MNAARSLRLRQARQELRRDPAVNAAIAVMIVLSAGLMASGAMMVERLVGGVDGLFAMAQPPHLLQMHKGDYDVDALESFAAEHPEIESWFIEEMVGFDGAAIAWERAATGERGDLSDSLVDNLFVSQNTEFDFLVDTEGAVPQPVDGEIYVPVVYLQRYDLQVGDELTIATSTGSQALTIAGFVRDAQMASSLSSATRFAVSPTDLQALAAAGGGVREIIVEYLLTDPALASELEVAYASDPALPMNGEGVTYTLIRMLNVLGDGLAAITLMFVALLLVAIALLNVRFVIRGRLQEEVRQIGVMKAIGLPERVISRMYLTRYLVLTALGCVVGGVLAVLALPVLTSGVQVNYAAGAFGLRTGVVLLLALAVVAAVVVVSCRRVLRRVRRVQVVDALVHGSLLDPRQAARRSRRAARRVRRTSLISAPGGSVARRLALLDLRAEARQWVLVPIVFFLAAVVMGLPAHLLTTLSSPSFVTHLGVPQADVRVDLQHTDDLGAVRTEVAAAVQQDDRITEVRQFAQVLLDVQVAEGWRTMPVELGDYSQPTIEYSQGRAPTRGEIALSIINADNYGVTVGDSMTLRSGGEVSSVVVSGIYPDVTSGGDTAKMAGDPTSVATAYVMFVDVAEGVDPVALAAEYDEAFPAAAVRPMAEFMGQTMSQMTGAVRSAAVLACVLGLAIATLIIALFMQLRLTRERRAMGTMSAIGFSVAEILAQLHGKVLVAAAAGTVLGTAAAFALGSPFMSLLMSAAGLGVATLPLVPNLMGTLTYPIVLVVAGLLAAVAATARLCGTDTSAWLRA